MGNRVGWCPWRPYETYLNVLSGPCVSLGSLRESDLPTESLRMVVVTGTGFTPVVRQPGLGGATPGSRFSGGVVNDGDVLCGVFDAHTGGIFAKGRAAHLVHCG